MPDEHLPRKVYYEELHVGKRSHNGQKKRYKDTLKAFLKDFNIPTESWEQIAQNRAKWLGLIRRGAGEYETEKKSAKPSRNVLSGKLELRHHQHQQSLLPQTYHVLSATGSLELRFVSSAILEHTKSTTSCISSGLVIVCNDRRTIHVYTAVLPRRHLGRDARLKIIKAKTVRHI